MRGATKAVYEYLKAGNSLTTKDAVEIFGTVKLPDIVYRLKDKGVIIQTIMIEGKTRFGDTCRYAKYIYCGEEETE